MTELTSVGSSSRFCKGWRLCLVWYSFLTSPVFLVCPTGSNVHLSAVAVLHRSPAGVLHDSLGSGSWAFLYQHFSELGTRPPTKVCSCHISSDRSGVLGENHRANDTLYIASLWRIMYQCMTMESECPKTQKLCFAVVNTMLRILEFCRWTGLF